MRELSKDNLLRSWKEIAAHLGCEVRTCHRWEQKLGMPVHRAEGSETKSLVFAYKDELDRWFQKTFTNSNLDREKNGRNERVRKRAAGALIVLGLAGAAYLIWGRRPPRQPADFAIDGSVLVVLDKQKRELWRWDSGMEDLKGEEYYRSHFQVLNHDSGSILPALVIKDINNDGDTEVLFAPKRVTDQTGEGRLYCYDRKGAELWSFRAGKELRCGGRQFSPDYRIAGFHTHDLDGDGRREIVVEAFHAPDWPCQFTVLDASGGKIGEFWNAGYLRDVAYQDLDGDGREEIIVVGVNNEYRTGCLVVFDSRDIRGGSPQSGEYACEGLGAGSELYYVTVPRTDVTEARGLFASDLLLLDITENRRIRATTTFGLIYEFDFGLKPLQVSWGHGYISNHQDLAGAGKVASGLDEAYGMKLIVGIRYWNGSAWTSEPSKNAR